MSAVSRYSTPSFNPSPDNQSAFIMMPHEPRPPHANLPHELNTSQRPTIVAISTAPGAGAVSMIRLSGPAARTIADLASDGNVSKQPARYARHCHIHDADGMTLDDGLMIVFPGPHSYTGEDTVEFTGHGGILVTREVLQRFLNCGAIHAGPGEFTRRAFLNGKIDLTQAEGVMDLISAQTRLSLRAARAQLDGALGKKTTAARDQLLHSLAHLEAWIDFPEEDISPETGSALLNGIQSVIDTIDIMLATADQGRILREGIRTVIYGEPNVGKSSLLNQLLGFNRAIVSDTAGTTRDTIEEMINLNGIPLRLVDTAGVRQAADSIEAEGILRTNQQIDYADLLLEVFNGHHPKPLTYSPASPQQLQILNKSDLSEDPSWHDTTAIRISCKTGEGFDQLSTQISQKLHLHDLDWGDHAIAINARHQASLLQARLSLTAAIDTLKTGSYESELAAIDIREALDALGEIPGKVDTEDLLGVIFSSFCIGK